MLTDCKMFTNKVRSRSPLSVLSSFAVRPVAEFGIGSDIIVNQIIHDCIVSKNTWSWLLCLSKSLLRASTLTHSHLTTYFSDGIIFWCFQKNIDTSLLRIPILEQDQLFWQKSDVFAQFANYLKPSRQKMMTTIQPTTKPWKVGCQEHSLPLLSNPRVLRHLGDLIISRYRHLHLQHWHRHHCHHHHYCYHHHYCHHRHHCHNLSWAILASSGNLATSSSAP